MIDMALPTRYTDGVNVDPLIGWIEFHREVCGLFRTRPRNDALDSSKIIRKSCGLETDLRIVQKSTQAIVDVSIVGWGAGDGVFLVFDPPGRRHATHRRLSSRSAVFQLPNSADLVIHEVASFLTRRLSMPHFAPIVDSLDRDVYVELLTLSIRREPPDAPLRLPSATVRVARSHLETVEQQGSQRQQSIRECPASRRPASAGCARCARQSVTACRRSRTTYGARTRRSSLRTARERSVSA